MDRSPSREEASFGIELNASPDLTRRIWKSYGAMTTFFEYLGIKEALKFQGADKWMYNRGVCRVFVRIRWPEEVRYFVDPVTGRVIRYEARNGVVSEGEVLPDWQQD